MLIPAHNILIKDVREIIFTGMIHAVTCNQIQHIAQTDVAETPAQTTTTI